MPTVAVDKEDLWDRLGYRYSEYSRSNRLFCEEAHGLDCLAPEEFDHLLFEFGLELDEDVRVTDSWILDCSPNKTL